MLWTSRHIREIIKPREITDIPRVPDFILGIISLRGIIIPVFDLKKRLNWGQRKFPRPRGSSFASMEDRVIGLLVDSITQVVRLSDAADRTAARSPFRPDREMVEGVGRSQGKMLILLHLALRSRC